MIFGPSSNRFFFAWYGIVLSFPGSAFRIPIGPALRPKNPNGSATAPGFAPCEPGKWCHWKSPRCSLYVGRTSSLRSIHGLGRD